VQRISDELIGFITNGVNIALYAPSQNLMELTVKNSGANLHFFSLSGKTKILHMTWMAFLSPS
jgi:hypothetical protein